MSMGMPEKSNPFELLLRINQLYMDSGISLPNQKKLHESIWVGVGFKLNQYRFVIAIEHLEEVLPEPSYAPIPIVKRWLKGVANMRGHLLPIVDLNELFGISSEASRKQRRVMAIKNLDGGYVGFLVDAVFGMQSFSIDSRSVTVDNLPEEIRPFVSASYQDNELVWSVFDANKFMESPQFLRVDR